MVKKPITIEEAHKWFDEQKVSNQSSFSGDNSLFNANPRWASATMATSQLGSEFLIAPLNLSFSGRRCIPRLLVRRDSSGELSGRYLLYLPENTNGIYSPSNFTGCVIYTDFYGHYLHGYKVLNGNVVGLATAARSDGRGNAHSRGCIAFEVCTPVIMQAFGGEGETCITVVNCSAGGSTSHWTSPGGWSSGSGGTGGGNNSSGGGPTWGSNQPPISLGELSQEARQFLTTKGFSEFQMDWLSTKPGLLDQNLNFLRTDGSEAGALFARKHTDTYISDLNYRQANLTANHPALGTEAWASTLRFNKLPPNAAEIALSVLYPVGALQIAINAITANLKEDELFPNHTSNGTERSNSFKHAYWNALNAASVVVGPVIAKLFGDAHESGQTGLATEMDLFNNAVGIQIGIDTGTFMSEGERANRVLDAVNIGLLKYLCNFVLVFTNQSC